MADQSLLDLSHNATPGADARIYIVSDPGGTPTDEYAEWGDLPAGGGGALVSIDDPTLWPGSADDEEFNAAGSTSLPSGWAWVNQGASTYLEKFGAGVIDVEGGSSGTTWRGIVRSHTWADGDRLVAKLIGRQKGTDSSNNYRAALWARNSSTGAFASLGNYNSIFSASGGYAEHWNSPTSFNGALGSALTVAEHYAYYAITRVSSTSWTFEISPDGCVWLPVASGIDISSIAPDQIGFGAANSGGAVARVGCHWMRVD